MACAACGQRYRRVRAPQVAPVATKLRTRSVEAPIKKEASTPVYVTPLRTGYQITTPTLPVGGKLVSIPEETND